MFALEVDIRIADLRMKSRLSIALVTALGATWIAVAVPSDAGPCRHGGAHECVKPPATLDFSSVPDISSEIAGNQSNPRPPRRPPVDLQPAADPYTGPMIGGSRLGGNRVGVPTVGYYWSIN
jgi:hypothetical protein